MSTSRPIHTLYLCYFGLREPLVQTQVIPYLEQLTQGEVSVSLLTFEANKDLPWSAAQIGRWREELKSKGIHWYFLRYHKWPSLPATLYDIVAGAWFASALARRNKIDVMHGRSHVGAAIGTLGKQWCGSRLIFDIRGFLPEEYVDAGLWVADGFLYRLTKRVERRLLAAADGFVVLTEQARRALFPGCTDRDSAGRPLEVIPCCVDFDRFRPANAFSKECIREELGIGNRRVICYVGALGGWYLTEQMADFLAVAHYRNPATFSMILTQSPCERVVRHLRAAGLAEKDYLIRQVPPQQVPRYLKAADLGLFFCKSCYSKLSSSPTKVGEYLASGIPVVSSAGIGDLDGIIEGGRVGVVVREFSHAAYRQALGAAERLLQETDISERCRATAHDRFDLRSIGGPRYRRLYQRVVEKYPLGATTSQVTV
jgi:glycosyltransferase involved in cell wall biosynthesis